MRINLGDLAAQQLAARQRGGALLVVALLGTLLGCSSIASGHTATPTVTASLDPTTQAYVTLLRNDYVPFVNANGPVKACYLNVLQSPTPTKQATQMAKCPDPANAQLALAQTLQTGLAAATPPARWQADHDQLKKAVAGVIGLLSTQLAAAAAQDVQGFLGSSDLIRTYGPLFCDPIKHINAGPPPLTPKLDPLDLMFCAGGE